MKIPKIPIPSLPIPTLGKKKTRLVVEIGEEWLRLVASDEKGPARKISFFEAHSIKDKADLDIGQLISESLKGHNCRPTEIVISHPSHNLTTRMLSLPSIDPREIGDMIELQAVKQTPYTKDEITTGFEILDSDPTGYSRVLLAISHRDIATRYVNVSQLSGFQPTKLTISLSGIQEWYGKVVASAGKVTPDESILLLNVDATTSDFLIVHNGKLVFARNLAFGASHFANLGSVKEEFLQELLRSVDAGVSELKGKELSKVILTGAQDVLGELNPIIAQGVGKPCETVNVVDGIEKFVPTKGIEAQTSKGLSFVSTLGIALQTTPFTINLIPQEQQIQKGIEERAKDLAVLGTLLLALVTLISAVGFEKYYRKSAYLGKLKKEYKVIRKEASDIERLVAKMKLADEQLSSGGSFLEVLRDINETIPDDIYLTYLQHNDKERNVTIRGLSDEMSSVFQLLSTLEATPHLEFVKTRNVTKRRVEDRDVSEFEIVANIKSRKPVAGAV